jgi:phage protein D
VPKGTPIKAAIIHDNQRLECGSFWIDDIHFSIGQSGSTLDLKANSVPPGGSGKGTKQYRAWEGADLKTISNDLATDSGLELDWQIENPPKLSRVDQDGESNLEMINRLADENGGQVTVKNGKLIVYDEAEWEKREPFTEIHPGSSAYESIRLHTTAVGKFAESQESWTSPRTGRTVDEDFSPEEKPEGAGAKLKSYRRYNRAGDDDEDTDDPDSPLGRDYEWELGPQAIAETKGDRKTKAATRAKKELRKANKDEWTCDLSNMPGDIRWNSGQTFTLSSEFGKFGRKYLVDSVTHTVSRSGYKSSAKGRGVLKGYYGNAVIIS